MFEFYHDDPKQSTKICPECHIEKPLNEFPLTQPRCKQCEMARRKQRDQEILSIISADATKVCKKCGIEKPLNDFYKATGGVFGHTAKCKLCTLEAMGHKSHLPQYPSAQHGGKVCHKCHEEKTKEDFNKESKRPDGLSLLCKECSRAYHGDYEYRTGHRKRSAPLPAPVNGGQVCTKCEIEKPWSDFQINKRRKEGYSVVCKECLNKRGRERYITAYKENILKKNRLWYANNTERHYALTRKWTIANRTRANEISHQYRARKMTVTKVEEVDFIHILERDNCWCYICNGEIRPEHKIDFDHVIPLSRGGTHTEDNIKVTHHRCNRRKHNKFLEEMSDFQRRGVQ